MGDYEKIMQEMQRAAEQAKSFSHNVDNGPLGFLINAQLWLADHPTVSWILVGLYFSSFLYSVWHCLSRLTGIDRLTWLIVLNIPALGIIFYWLLINREIEPPNFGGRESARSETTPPQPPNVAAEINASIAEAIRQKREKKS